MKKAMELSILCDCDVALVVSTRDGGRFQYASDDVEKAHVRIKDFNIHETVTNKDVRLLSPGL